MPSLITDTSMIAWYSLVAGFSLLSGFLYWILSYDYRRVRFLFLLSRPEKWLDVSWGWWGVVAVAGFLILIGMLNFTRRLTR